MKIGSIKNQRMDVMGDYFVEDVLPYVGTTKKYINWILSLTSLRYQTFTKSVVCQHCGLKGSIMRLERDLGMKKINGIPHFNLYAVDDDGQLVLMTRDHIIPRSKGGEDTLQNSQTLCLKCNLLKGNEMPLQKVEK